MLKKNDKCINEGGKIVEKWTMCKGPDNWTFEHFVCWTALKILPWTTYPIITLSLLVYFSKLIVFPHF